MILDRCQASWPSVRPLGSGRKSYWVGGSARISCAVFFASASHSEKNVKSSWVVISDLLGRERWDEWRHRQHNGIRRGAPKRSQDGVAERAARRPPRNGTAAGDQASRLGTGARPGRSSHQKAAVPSTAMISPITTP